MNVLIIGSGGREHALAWKLAQSPLLNKLFIAPGNAGTILHGTNLSIAMNDFEGIGTFVLAENINMVVVGPEDPLVHGIHDYFLATPGLHHIPVIGPVKAGAMLEGSKDFAKQFMFRHNIPTAQYQSFTQATLDKGLKFLEDLEAPFVLKADGLAAGKGVLILYSLQEARDELTRMLGGKFGNASKTVVIEQFLEGIEMSAFVLTDGKSYKILPEAKDYKRVGEGDTGLNTGGMGAISPVPFANKEFLHKVEERIIRRTINGLIADGISYRGFIFFGLMNVSGDPYLIEYNVRLGDPESEVVLPRITSDLIELFIATAAGKLEQADMRIDHRFVTTVMIVSGGYPGDYIKGLEIHGLDKIKNSIAFHAGTKFEHDRVNTNGGRVLAISSYGQTMNEALDLSYQNAKLIHFRDMYFRNDIGFDLR